MSVQPASKVMSAAEAVSAFVHDGNSLAVGGFVTNRRPYGLVREIIRQQKRNLYVEGGSSGGDIDMLIGAGCVAALQVSYIANSGFSQVGRRFRAAVESGTLLYEDFSLDVQTIAYHGAALGLPYMPVKNMMGSDLVNRWGISREERARHPKLSREKFIIQDDPFHPGSSLCCVPSPEIDVACVHVQMASPDGTCRILGAPFQDVDIAMAAKSTIVSCESLVSNEEIRRHPEYNTLMGLCIDAVVPLHYGAHPSQCFGQYDYDPTLLWEYDIASRTDEGFAAFIDTYITRCPTFAHYMDCIGAARLSRLNAQSGVGYVQNLKRK